MKLFVDDIRNAPDDTWTVARTVNSAIKAIARFNFEVISLDHDISHQVTVGALGRPYPCEETFQAVAYFIGEHCRDWNITESPKIILHTSNPVGAKEMESILAGYGIKCDVRLTGAANRLEMEI